MVVSGPIDLSLGGPDQAFFNTMINGLLCLLLLASNIDVFSLARFIIFLPMACREGRIRGFRHPCCRGQPINKSVLKAIQIKELVPGMHPNQGVGPRHACKLRGGPRVSIQRKDIRNY